MQRTFDRPEEKALLASLSYDFSGLGVDGLSAIVNFAAGFDGKLNGGRSDAQEVDVTIDYRVKKEGWMKSFWLRVRGCSAHIREVILIPCTDSRRSSAKGESRVATSSEP